MFGHDSTHCARVINKIYLSGMFSSFIISYETHTSLFIWWWQLYNCALVDFCWILLLCRHLSCLFLSLCFFFFLLLGFLFFFFFLFYSLCIFFLCQNWIVVPTFFHFMSRSSTYMAFAFLSFSIL
jgi:hypothetical protein